MNAWLAQTPVLVTALALLVIPGLPVGLLLRGVSAVVRLGMSIGVSLGIVAASSLVAPVLGMRWGLLPVGIVSAVVWAVAATLRLLGRRSATVPAGRTGGAVWLAIAAAFAGWVVILVVGIGSPNDPSQLYDGLFHLNAVEFVAATGDASPLHMTMVLPGHSTSFYPTLWHALTSLVLPVAGGVVPATNVVTIAVIALVWPVALATVTRVVFPSWPAAAIWAPLVGFAFSVFPLGFLNWGVLYPNLIGTALIPILIAAVLLAFAPAIPWPGRTLRLLVALAVAAGTGLGHPSALLGALVLLLPFVLWRAWEAARRGGAATRVVVGLSVAVGSVAFVALWSKANVTTHEWLPTQTIAQASGEVLFLSPVGRSTGLLLGILVLLGVWRAARERLWWVLVSYLVSAVLYLASAWLPVLPLRSFLVGIWYDDTTRVAALLAIWGLPLAALGMSLVVDRLHALWRAGRRVTAIVLIGVIALLAATHLLALRNDLRYMRDVSYRFDGASQGLSPDEAALFERLEAELPEDALVIGDPLTGAGLLFAYTGHDVVFPHVTGRYGTDAALLARTLVEGDAAVCDAIENLGVTHALDFGDTVLFQNHYTTYDGLHDLDEASILTEVDRVGDATLYEVTGCD
ncbi:MULTISPECIES: DUF6541 family protein [Microbacterium]|uniref:DUF6541 family protein n=1 Tax=Microbacterium TaxID=33882 RepID=UPI0028ED15A4|nr:MULTISPECIES: DUF6541 family protein [Microbacterium]